MNEEAGKSLSNAARNSSYPWKIQSSTTFDEIFPTSLESVSYNKMLGLWKTENNGSNPLGRVQNTKVVKQLNH